MSQQHTPGPWIVRSDGTSGDYSISANGTGIFVEILADIRRAGEMARDEALANARLIAAAPDLLVALRKSAELLSRYRNETPLGHQPHMIANDADWAIKEAMSALDKAEPAQ